MAALTPLSTWWARAPSRPPGWRVLGQHRPSRHAAERVVSKIGFVHVFRPAARGSLGRVFDWLQTNGFLSPSERAELEGLHEGNFELGLRSTMIWTWISEMMTRAKSGIAPPAQSSAQQPPPRAPPSLSRPRSEKVICCRRLLKRPTNTSAPNVWRRIAKERASQLLSLRVCRACHPSSSWFARR